MGSLKSCAACLAADSKLRNEIAVALLTLASDVAKQTLATTNHLEKPLAGRIIVDVLLKMAAELRDALAQHGDLNFCRSGVGGVGLVAVDELLLFSCIERHAKRPALLVQTTNLPLHGHI